MPTATAPAKTRLSADERRRQIVEIAAEEFASRGLHGTSTETIAERAGVSQPYLFRLFGTKKDLFIAAVELGFRRISERFAEVAGDVPREEALDAMAKVYGKEYLADRTMLLAQMQAYAACDDADVQAVVRRGFADVYRIVAAASGAGADEMKAFLSTGMLLNVAAAMNLRALDEPWAKEMLAACLPEPE
ncbi:MAG TPA: TetR/AcrR family transcriptional regulator [Gaiellaceae bacterium]